MVRVVGSVLALLFFCMSVGTVIGTAMGKSTAQSLPPESSVSVKVIVTESTRKLDAGDVAVAKTPSEEGVFLKGDWVKGQTVTAYYSGEKVSEQGPAIYMTSNPVVYNEENGRMGGMLLGALFAILTMFITFMVIMFND